MSNKKQPSQLETATTHNGKDHTSLVTKVRDAKPDPSAQKAAHAARKAATNDSKYGKK